MFLPKKQKPKEHRKFLEVMDMFSILVVVMVSWVYAYIQTHQVVHIKCVQFFFWGYIDYISIMLK